MEGTTIQVGEQEIQRLQRELVIWLTTVRSDGTPQPTPVWFLWENGTFLVYSQPNAQKLRNIAQNPKVALNLNCDERGDCVVVFFGNAKIETNVPPADQAPSYIRKYREWLPRIEMTPQSFAQSYSVAIRITPTHVRNY